MNPIIVLGIILAGVLFWFILSFIFPWVGGLIFKMYKSAQNNINKEIKKKEKEEDEKR